MSFNESIFKAMTQRLLVLTLLLGGGLARASGPETFMYQGHLTRPDGSDATDVVNIRFQIYSPDGSCLLYEELHSGVDLSISDGHFALAVGSPLTSSKRTLNDPGLAMTDIFTNKAAVLRPSGPNCSTAYQPISGDRRKLRVSIDHGGVIDVLSPDEVIQSVPFAMTAETLQGKQPGDFIQSTLPNMQQLIEQLLQGTLVSSLAMNSQRITGLGAPVSGGDAANKTYTDTRMGGRMISSTILAEGQVLAYNSVTDVWEPRSITPNVICNATEALSWNGTAWSCINISGSGGAGAGAGSATGTMDSHVSTSFADVVLTNSSAKTVYFNNSMGGTITLPDAQTLTTGGPIFTLINKSPFPITVKKADGDALGILEVGKVVPLFLIGNTTLAGEWASNLELKGAIAGVERAFILAQGLSNLQLCGYTRLSPTEFVWLYVDNGALKAVGGDINVATKAFISTNIVVVESSGVSDCNTKWISAYNLGKMLVTTNINAGVGGYDGKRLTKSGSTLAIGAIVSGFSYWINNSDLTRWVIKSGSESFTVDSGMLKKVFDTGSTFSLSNVASLSVSSEIGKLPDGNIIAVSMDGSCGINAQVISPTGTIMATYGLPAPPLMSCTSSSISLKVMGSSIYIGAIQSYDTQKLITLNWSGSTLSLQSQYTLGYGNNNMTTMLRLAEFGGQIYYLFKSKDSTIISEVAPILSANPIAMGPKKESAEFPWWAELNWVSPSEFIDVIAKGNQLILKLNLAN